MNENTRAGDTTDDYENTEDVATQDLNRLKNLPASPLIGARNKYGAHTTGNAASNTRGSQKISQISTQHASADYGSNLTLRIKELKKIKQSKFGKSKFLDSQLNHGEMDIATPSVMGKQSKGSQSNAKSSRNIIKFT